MSATHTDVPPPVEHVLPAPVPRDEYETCPVTAIVRRLGDKWTLLVMTMLRAGPRRFNDLERSIEGISQRMLTRTLRGLEEDGIVRRTVFPTNPPSVEYALTTRGVELMVAMDGLARWAVGGSET